MTELEVDILIFNDCTTAHQIWCRTAGPYRIATELRKLGLRVQVVDFFSHVMMEEGLWRTIIDKFVGPKTLWIGLSTTFLSSFLYMAHNHPYWRGSSNNTPFNRRTVDRLYGGVPRSEMQELKDYARSKSPNITFVAGGADVRLTDTLWDVLCLGYGEQHIIDYTRWRIGKNPFFQYKVHNAQMLLDYDTKASKFDFVRSQIKWEIEDCIQPGETLPIEISRGCIFKCKFCFFPLNGKSKLDFIKERDVLLEEFRRNYELFGTTRYVFSDDTYNDTTTKLEFMNEVVSRLPFKLEFGTYGRLDLLTAHPEQIELLKQNGAKSMMFGIESLNHASGKSIGKGMAPERLVDTLYQLRSVWKNDIQVNSGFIVGLPHDTYETMDRWLDRITRADFPLHSFNIAPLGIRPKGNRVYVSELEEDPGKFGYTMLENGGWVNTEFNTTFRGCNELAEAIALYTTDTGRLGFPTHQAMTLPGYGISMQDNLTLGTAGIGCKRTLYNAVNSMFINYIHEILNLEA